MAVFSRERIQGIVHGQDFSRGSAQLNLRFMELLAGCCRPRFWLALRRALSIRMRRMASAAAPKKWLAPPLLPVRAGQLQPGFVDQRGRLQRLPGVSWAILAAASLRNSS